MISVYTEVMNTDTGAAKQRVTIDLEPSLHERLRKAAFERRESMSDIMREALSDWLGKHQEEDER